MLDSQGLFVNSDKKAVEWVDQLDGEGKSPQAAEADQAPMANSPDDRSLPLLARARRAQDVLEEAVLKASAHQLDKYGSLSAEQVSQVLEGEISRFLDGLSVEMREVLLAYMLKDRCAHPVYQVVSRIEARLEGRAPTP